MKWGEMCTGDICKSGNLTDPNNEGEDKPRILHALEYVGKLSPFAVPFKYIGTTGAVESNENRVITLYSAFHQPFKFDQAFRGPNTILNASLGRKPRRLRIWEDTFSQKSAVGSNSSGELLPVWYGDTLIKVSANPYIPTAITFQLVDSTCPDSGLLVQHARDLHGSIVGWEVVVGGVDSVAKSMLTCTGVLQATDSTTNEVLQVARIQASVPDCFAGSTVHNITSNSQGCGGHGDCLPDPDLYDGRFAGCACNAGFAGERCSYPTNDCTDTDPTFGEQIRVNG
jgi:hypothetical protein